MSIINISNSSSNYERNCAKQKNANSQSQQMEQMALFVTETYEINKSNEVFISSYNSISNKFGWSPLYRTIIASNNEATVELLKMGADPNKPNNVLNF